MSFFGKNGLAQEDMYKLRERFSSIIKEANKDPKDFEAYYKKEATHIATQVLELPREEAVKKALEMIETSARFELVRKDVVRGLLDGTI
jgi:vacuolar-type H+-ATPase subunit H